MKNKYNVYHSSNVKFDKFDISKISNDNGDLYGSGFYFSDNLQYTKIFGKYNYKCNITLNNPLNLTNDIIAPKQLNSLLELVKNVSEVDLEHIKSSIRSKTFTSAFRLLRKYISFETLSNLYDGVIGYCEQGGKEYVVYNPDNIKIKNTRMLKRFNEFVNENISNSSILKDYLIGGKYLYHYTLTENLEDILEEGLLPRKNPNSYYKDGSNGIFLTTSGSLYNTNLPETLMQVMNDYNENIEEYDNKPLVRLWIDVSKLDINKFIWDDDYILNKYGWNKALDKLDKVIESLELWGSIAYLDNIPSNLIVKYDFDYSN